MASNGGIVPPRAGIRPALIKNKAKRAQVHAKQRAEKKEYRRKMREKRQREVAELGDDNPRPKAVRQHKRLYVYACLPFLTQALLRGL